MKRLLALLLLLAAPAASLCAGELVPLVFRASNTEATNGTPDVFPDAQQVKNLVDGAVATPLSWQGTWSAGTDYAAGDGVVYNGSSYAAVGDPTTGDVPGVDADWQLIAAQGVQGPAGADGTNGADGAPGADGADGTDGGVLPAAADDEYAADKLVQANDRRLTSANTPSNRATTITASGDVTTSTDTATALGKSHLPVDPNGSNRAVIFTSPDADSPQSIVVTNVGDGGEDLTYGTLTVGNGYHLVARWDGDSWEVSSDDPRDVWDALSTYSLVLPNATASTSTTTGALVVTGGVGIGGQLTVGSNVVAGSSSIIGWPSSSRLAAPADGVIRLSNAAASDFGRLTFGGTTSSFPALKRAATSIEVRLADDSAYARLYASNLQLLHGTGAYSASFAVDFTAGGYVTVSLTGNITFTTSNLAGGRSVTVRIISDGSSRTLAFPGTWVFVGSAAPSSIAASKTAILTLTSFGTTDADVVAAYSVQP